MMESFSESSLSAALVWVHFALLAVPLLALMTEIEWKEWKEHHPRKLAPAHRRRFSFYPGHRY